MYPLYPGRADMVLGSPSFSNAKIIRSQGAIQIEAINASPKNIYVKSLSINNTATLKSWITEELIKNGGKLKFEMSSSKNEKFGNHKNQPPSYSFSTKN